MYNTDLVICASYRNRTSASRELHPGWKPWLQRAASTSWSQTTCISAFRLQTQGLPLLWNLFWFSSFSI